MTRGVESSSSELGSSTTHSSFGLPFLRLVETSRSIEFSPVFTELEVESRRHGGVGLFLVVGLIHPDFIEVSIDFIRNRLAEFVLIFAFSTSHNELSTVAVLDSQLTPNGPVGGILLVPRSNLVSLTPRLGFNCF